MDLWKTSSKTDINNVLLHLSNDTNGHVWAVIAADRLSTSGDSYIDFEFLQSPLTLNGNGTITSSGSNGGRSTNDILLSVGFTGGGKVADFFAWRWQASGSGFAYANVTTNLPAGRVFVAMNTNTIVSPYSAFGQMSYAPNAFAEAAVDLTALLGNFDACISVGFKTIMVKTKASSSSSASIEDFINPIQFSLNIGPGANAGPDQVRCNEGTSTSFALQGAASSGLQAVGSIGWSVVSGEAMIDDAASLVTAARVSTASATLRLTVTQINGCVTTDDVVLTAQPTPICAITGVTNTCPRTTNTFSALVGMNAYSWTVVGNASISGPTNQSTVKVVAGAACGAAYSLSLTTITNVCTVSCSTEVTVVDTDAPVLTCPSDLILDCPAITTTNVTGRAAATDSCSRATVTYSDLETNGCGPTRVIARTWTATDECGNSVSCVQTITVRDVTPPVLSCPTNRTLEFPADTTPANTGMATATDGCSSTGITFNDLITTNCGNSLVIVRTWTASDQCNNFASCNQTITVRDTTAPQITCPANVSLEYPAITTTNITGAATASDASGSFTINYTDTTPTNCGNTYTISRRWTASDQCANTAICTQIITVRDTTPPLITCPANFTLECPAVTTTNATGVATATDAAGSVSMAFVDLLTNGCGNNQTIARRWTATDSCGNSSSCTQTIIVRDTTAPIINCPTNVTMEYPAITTTNVTGAATASDACGSFTITYSDTITTNCGSAHTISRRWTVTDQCNNSSSCIQIITVRDTTAPVVTCPASVTLDCPAVTTTNSTGVATATDAGGQLSITYIDSITNSCGNTKTIARRWTATDLCGNSSGCVQTIVVRDITPPVLTCPSNITVDCGTSTLPGATGSATAVDTCNSTTVTYADASTNLCGSTKIITRTWMATDSCGNKATCHQTITVRDITPPALTVPANRIIECPGDTRTNATGVATAVDGCGSVSITYGDVVSNSCGATRTILRLWTATDTCGNTINGQQTINVVDTQKPRITCPSISVQCVNDLPSAYNNLTAFLTAGGTASDNCDADLTFSITSASSLAGSCPGTMTRVYRVTDDCGNFAEATQTILVKDTIAPLLTCAPGITVQCGESLAPAIIGRAFATDNCDTNVVVTYTDAIVPSSYSINWYAADPVSGSAPYLPTHLKLGPANLVCPTGGRAMDPLRHAVAYGPTSSQLDALTSLGGEPMSLGQIVPFEAVIEASGGTGPENGTIEFKASWSTHTTSNDEFGYDKNYKVYCAFVDPADPGSVDPHNNAKIDSFSSIMINTGTIDEKIQGTFRVSGLDSGDRVIVEVWVVLMSTQPDHVGGTIASDLVSAQKVMTPPEAIATGGKTISIGNLNRMTALPQPQQQPPLPTQFPQTPAPVGSLVSVITRTWTATDSCNNRSTCAQQITIRDATPPTIVAPENVVLECPADTRTNATGVAVAQDACGSVVIIYSDTISNSCGGTQIITRRWSATDQWGNNGNVAQTITVRDSTPPSISVLTNKIVSSATAIVFDTPTAIDTCGVASVHVVNTATNVIDSNTYTVTRIWKATDACGNDSSNQMQTISVQTPAIPRLALVKSSNSGLLIRWPANASEYRLECAESVPARRWYPVAITPIVTNSECWVYIEPKGPSQFFRLANTPPALEVLKLSNGSLHLTWPTAPSGFLLETSDTLAPGSWTSVSPSPGISNTLNHVNVPPNGLKKFFRLKK
ncbi:MAG: hypothetical protein ABIW93_02230 [Verrucomicrobiota bacterium]